MEVLVREDGGTVRNNSVSPMTGWRYDQVLTSAAFGLPLARGVSVEILIKEIRALYRKTKLTGPDRTNLLRLFRQLEEKSSRAYEDEFARKEHHNVGRTLIELKAKFDQGQTRR